MSLHEQKWIRCDVIEVPSEKEGIEWYDWCLTQGFLPEKGFIAASEIPGKDTRLDIYRNDESVLLRHNRKTVATYTLSQLEMYTNTGWIRPYVEQESSYERTLLDLPMTEHERSERMDYIKDAIDCLEHIEQKHEALFNTSQFNAIGEALVTLRFAHHKLETKAIVKERIE